jgi:hypothetical protein
LFSFLQVREQGMLRNEIDTLLIEEIFPLLCTFDIVNAEDFCLFAVIEVTDNSRTDEACGSCHDD